MAVQAGIAAVTLIAGAYQSNQVSKDQSGAQGRAERTAKKTADLQDQAVNKTNSKKPNLAGLYQANSLAGQSGTMLTGASGVDRSSLTLGKTTLLGG